MTLWQRAGRKASRWISLLEPGLAKEVQGVKGRVLVAALVMLLWGSIPHPVPGLKLLKSCWKMLI